MVTIYQNAKIVTGGQILEGFEVITENEAKVLDERNAVRYVYKMKLNGKEYQCMHTVAAFSNIFYVITYTSNPEFYENHLEDVERILSSFDFK